MTLSSDGPLRSLSFGTLGGLLAGESNGLAGVAEKYLGRWIIESLAETLGQVFSLRLGRQGGADLEHLWKSQVAGICGSESIRGSEQEPDQREKAACMRTWQRGKVGVSSQARSG